MSDKYRDMVKELGRIRDIDELERVAASIVRHAVEYATKVAWNQCADIVEDDLDRSKTDWQAVAKRMRRTAAAIRSAEPDAGDAA